MPRILNSSIGTGARYTLTGEYAFVPGYSTIFSDNSSGISAVDGSNYVTVQGTVAGFTGISLGDDVNDYANRIYITSAGLVQGVYAISLVSSAIYLDNAGEISGSSQGVSLTGTGTVVNSGSISGFNYGIYITGDGEITLTNTGTIHGTRSYDGSFGVDRIINAGRMDGEISLYSGNDIYDGRQGGFVNGIVYGGAGKDAFYGSSAHEDHFDGGSGLDTLRISGGAGAVIYLDGRESGGAAIGDTYVDIENAAGSNSGADRIYGTSAENVLNGRGGNDLLSGGAGYDLLIGGDGRDTMSGGAGNDVFVYNAVSEIGDVITDFSNSAGNNDAIRFDGSEFGGGLRNGALNSSQFRAGHFNSAQDSNDRFILRTNDMTLWFDRDGRGGAGPVMVADLHQSVHFSASDIFIF